MFLLLMFFPLFEIHIRKTQQKTLFPLVVENGLQNAGKSANVAVFHCVGNEFAIRMRARSHQQLETRSNVTPLISSAVFSIWFLL